MVSEIDRLKSMILATPKNAAGKRKFTQDLRSQILRFVNNSDYTLPEACRKLGMNTLTVSGWLKAAKTSAESGFKKVTILEEPKPTLHSDTIELISPDGFKLKGPGKELVRIWRELHASIT